MPNNDYRLKNIYLPQMDGFRGLFCIFIIIIHHHFTYANVPISLGYFGMHGFFILSSFLITRGLLIDKKKTGSFKTYYIKFYIKRILRIFPVYFFYLFFAVAAGLLTSDRLGNYFLGIYYELRHFGWMLITFTYNFKDLYCIYSGYIYNKSTVFSHLWSLSLEEQFYFIVPFMVYFMSEKALKGLTVAMILVFPLIRIVGFQWLTSLTDDVMQQSFIFYRNTFFQYDAFFYGTFLALFPVSLSNKQAYGIFYFLLAIFVLAIPVNGWIIHQHSGQNIFYIITHYDFMTRNGQYIYIDTLFNLLCTVFFYLCFTNEDSFPIFKKKFFVEVGGKMTYSTYVYQYIFIIPTLFITFPFCKNVLHWPAPLAELLTLILSVSAALLTSYFSYNTMETYFLSKKQKYLSKYKS